MRNTCRTERSRGRRASSAFMLGAGFLCLFALFSARAEDVPFEFDKGHWVSSDSYEEDLVRHPPPKEAPPAAETENKPAPAPNSPDNMLPPVVRTPLMPGMNKGLNILVDTTEDAKENGPSLEPENSQDIQLPENNWKTPSDGNLLSESGTKASESDRPLNVRMTYLPTRNVIPSSSPDRKSAAEKGHAFFKKTPRPKTPEEFAACSAMDSLKKQQLDAIESDRQTLQALQEAVHALGLSKQLDFMTEEKSALNPSDNQINAQPGMSLR